MICHQTPCCGNECAEGRCRSLRACISSGPAWQALPPLADRRRAKAHLHTLKNRNYNPASLQSTCWDCRGQICSLREWRPHAAQRASAAAAPAAATPATAAGSSGTQRATPAIYPARSAHRYRRLNSAQRKPTTAGATEPVTPPRPPSVVSPVVARAEERTGNSKRGGARSCCGAQHDGALPPKLRRYTAGGPTAVPCGAPKCGTRLHGSLEAKHGRKVHCFRPPGVAGANRCSRRDEYNALRVDSR